MSEGPNGEHAGRASSDAGSPDMKPKQSLRTETVGCNVGAGGTGAKARQRLPDRCQAASSGGERRAARLARGRVPSSKHYKTSTVRGRCISSNSFLVE